MSSRAPPEPPSERVARASVASYPAAAMFRREAWIMALMPVVMFAVGFLAALVVPRVLYWLR